MNNDIKYKIMVDVVSPKILENYEYKHKDMSPIWDQWDYMKKIARRLLTPRQYKIFVYLSSGVSIKDIAVKLNTTEDSVSHSKTDLINRLKYFIDITKRISNGNYYEKI